MGLAHALHEGFLHLVGFVGAAHIVGERLIVRDEDFSRSAGEWRHHSIGFQFRHQRSSLLFRDVEIIHQHRQRDGIARGNVFQRRLVERVGGLVIRLAVVRRVHNMVSRERRRRVGVRIHGFKLQVFGGNIEKIAVGFQHRLTLRAHHIVAHGFECFFVVFQFGATLRASIFFDSHDAYI